MMYQMHEARRSLLSPLSDFSAASAKLHPHPQAPFTHTPFASRVATGLHLVTLLHDTMRMLLQDQKIHVTDWIGARMVRVGAGALHLDGGVRCIQQFIRHTGPAAKRLIARAGAL
ncbi:hypothetical protein [Diaphorobacter caeni]|uniref:hypothetical protein n=1 Tax=Diaphorobacter caeni TaxID=2784387 RepID=UPI00188FFD56|nr:hypothetical protein [Diaphorobacter caeni]MBF5006909.1 hypothetical protein [Diaphorobacter caeni]